MAMRNKQEFNEILLPFGNSVIFMHMTLMWIINVTHIFLPLYECQKSCPKKKNLLPFISSSSHCIGEINLEAKKLNYTNTKDFNEGTRTTPGNEYEEFHSNVSHIRTFLNFGFFGSNLFSLFFWSILLFLLRNEKLHQLSQKKGKKRNV